MAVSFVAKGAFASGTGALTVGNPGSGASGDIEILFVESANETVATPSGFISFAQHGTGTAAAAGGVSITVFMRAWVDNTSSVSVADSGNHTCAIRMYFRGVDPSTWNVGSTTGTITSGMQHWVSNPYIDIPQAYMICAGALDRDAASTIPVQYFANPSLTGVTNLHSQTVASGLGGGLAIGGGTYVTGGSLGQTEVFLEASSIAVYLTFGLRPFNDAIKTYTPSGGATFGGSALTEKYEEPVYYVAQVTTGITAAQSQIMCRGGMDWVIMGCEGASTPYSNIQFHALNVATNAGSSKSWFISGKQFEFYSGGVTTPSGMAFWQGLETSSGVGDVLALWSDPVNNIGVLTAVLQAASSSNDTKGSASRWPYSPSSMIAMSGGFYGGSTTNSQGYVKAYSDTGTLSWTRRFDTGSKYADYGVRCAVGPDNKVAVLGGADVNGNYPVIVFDSSGNKLWSVLIQSSSINIGLLTWDTNGDVVTYPFCKLRGSDGAWLIYKGEYSITAGGYTTQLFPAVNGGMYLVGYHPSAGKEWIGHFDSDHNLVDAIYIKANGSGNTIFYRDGAISRVTSNSIALGGHYLDGTGRMLAVVIPADLAQAKQLGTFGPSGHTVTITQGATNGTFTTAVSGWSSSANETLTTTAFSETAVTVTGNSYVYSPAASVGYGSLNVVVGDYTPSGGLVASGTCGLEIIKHMYEWLPSGGVVTSGSASIWSNVQPSDSWWITTNDLTNPSVGNKYHESDILKVLVPGSYGKVWFSYNLQSNEIHVKTLTPSSDLGYLVPKIDHVYGQYTAYNSTYIVSYNSSIVVLRKTLGVSSIGFELFLACDRNTGEVLSVAATSDSHYNFWEPMVAQRFATSCVYYSYSPQTYYVVGWNPSNMPSSKARKFNAFTNVDSMNVIRETADTGLMLVNDWQQSLYLAKFDFNDPTTGTKYFKKLQWPTKAPVNNYMYLYVGYGNVFEHCDGQSWLYVCGNNYSIGAIQIDKTTLEVKGSSWFYVYDMLQSYTYIAPWQDQVARYYDAGTNTVWQAYGAYATYIGVVGFNLTTHTFVTAVRFYLTPTANATRTYGKSIVSLKFDRDDTGLFMCMTMIDNGDDNAYRDTVHAYRFRLDPIQATLDMTNGLWRMRAYVEGTFRPQSYYWEEVYPTVTENALSYTDYGTVTSHLTSRNTTPTATTGRNYTYESKSFLGLTLQAVQMLKTYWYGSWVSRGVKKWNGTTWTWLTKGALKKWNGSTWNSVD